LTFASYQRAGLLKEETPDFPMAGFLMRMSGLARHQFHCSPGRIHTSAYAALLRSAMSGSSGGGTGCNTSLTQGKSDPMVLSGMSFAFPNNPNTDMKYKILIPALALPLLFIACQKKETVTEQMEAGADKVAEGMKDMADATKEGMDDAAEKAKNMADEAAAKMKAEAAAAAAATRKAADEAASKMREEAADAAEAAGNAAEDIKKAVEPAAPE
jgi:hypothetical protein